MSKGRNTTVRDRHRNQIARGKPPCGICHEDIDYTLKSPHPRSYVVDHVLAISKGGPDTLENKQASHRDCNQAKYDKLPDGFIDGRRTFITEREW